MIKYMMNNLKINTKYVGKIGHVEHEVTLLENNNNKVTYEINGRKIVCAVDDFLDMFKEINDLRNKLIVK